MRRFIFFFLVALFFQDALCQDIIPKFNNLGVNDGLASNSVYSILQDKKGFIWLGTSDGICRYDGNEFKNYKCYPNDIHGLVNANNSIPLKNEKSDKKNGKKITTPEAINNFIRGKIIEDKEGNIWFSNESGIYKWDQKKENIDKILISNYSINGELKLIKIDSTGKLWFSNLTQGIISYNPTSNKIKVFPFPFKFDFSKPFHSFFAVDDNGSILFRIFSKDEPCYTFDIKQEIFSPFVSLSQPHGVFFENKNILIDYDKMIVIKNRNNDNVLNIIKNNSTINEFTYINDVVWDNKGFLWLSTVGNGLICYNMKSNQLKKFKHDNLNRNSLPFDLTVKLLIDKTQNLWIGTDGGGISKLDLKKPKFNLFPVFESDYPQLKDYFTKCFYEDEDKKIWFGTLENGLNIFDPNNNKLTNFKCQKNNPNSLPGNTVSSILEINNHQFLIGCNGGITFFNKLNKTFKKLDIKNLPASLITSSFLINKMIKLKNGEILVASSLGIIKVIQKGDFFEGYYFKNNPILISNTVDIVELPNSIVYAAIQGVGIYLLKPKEKAYDLIQIIFKDFSTRSMRVDDVNPKLIWISTSFGLIQFNTQTQKYQLWNEKNGLNNSYVYGTLEDEYHNIWMSTNGGLSCFDTKKNKFQNFTFLEGLQGNEFNSHAFFKSKSNTFYFGGTKGFNWFQSEINNNEKFPPNVVITKIEINNEKFQPNENFEKSHLIQLAHHKNDLNFHFAILDFSHPEANKIQYKLEGWDKDWITTKNVNVSYNNLLPGEYYLKYRAINADQLYSNFENIKLHIDFPFWQQYWFLILVFLFSVFIIVGFTYFILKTKEKTKLRALQTQLSIEAERSRISADMHDEIGSGITQITLFGEHALHSAKNIQDIRNDMSNIVSTSRNLIMTMSEIIWSMNTKNDNLERLLAYIRERSNVFFEPFDVQLKIMITDDLPDIQLSNEICRNIYLTTKELLNNCLKHSEASIVELSVNIDDDYCFFEINDNGKGFSENNIKVFKNGIRNVQNRIRAIGGHIEWFSSNQGTCVKFNFSTKPKTDSKIDQTTSKLHFNNLK